MDAAKRSRATARPGVVLARRAIAHPAAAVVVLLFSVSLAVDMFGLAESRISLSDRLQPPVMAGGDVSHPLGTDLLGRDVLTRMVQSAKYSIGLSIFVVVVASSFGSFVGVVAAYKGGRVGAVTMRIVDGLLSFPGLLFAVVVLFLFGPGFFNLLIAVTALSWLNYARIGFADGLRVRELGFVLAAQVSGLPRRRIYARYMWPALKAPLLSFAAIHVGLLILGEAALSFLGLGIQPPDVSWGLIIAEGRSFFPSAWWLTVFPGIAIATTAISMSLWVAHVNRVTTPQARAAVRAEVSPS